MFTGIITAIGEVAAIDKQGDWALTVKAGALPLDKMAPGASVACNGICLTVIEKSAGQFKVQISMETLSKTTAVHWAPGRKLNLEGALRAGDELGGHLVLGHVDGTARVLERKPEGDSLRYRFEVPHSFARYVAPKGAITLDGVSLTVNEAEGARFGVNLVPHTRKNTVLDALKPGDEVNFEIDPVARYVERILLERNAS